jgi:hypothetical protein
MVVRLAAPHSPFVFSARRYRNAKRNATKKNAVAAAIK